MKRKFIVLLFLFLILFLACPPDPPDPPVTTTSTTVVTSTTTTTTIPEPIPEPEPPYLGTSFYQWITENEENTRWFAGQLKKNRVNATEIFLHFTWSNGWKNSFYKQVGTWSEDKFGDYEFPMFDLNQRNEATWSKLKLIMELCRDNGIALFMRIQDYCSIKDPFEKRHYPYNNGSNTQEYSGGQWGEPIKYWYSVFNQQLIQLIKLVRLEHYFIIAMNEADVLGDDWPGGETEKDLVCHGFHKFYVDDFIRLGVKKSQLIMCIDRPNVRADFASQDYWLEIHGIASPESLANAYQQYGNNIFPNGDGATCGHGFSSHGYSEPDCSQMCDMWKMIQDNNWIGFLYFLRRTEETENASILKADFSALDELTMKIRHSITRGQ